MPSRRGPVPPWKGMALELFRKQRGAVPGTAHDPRMNDTLPPAQPRNPLHGLTLEVILTALVDDYGWRGLAERIPLRCFINEPSIKSSLKFLRKTPWAREKVEDLYLSTPGR